MFNNFCLFVRFLAIVKYIWLLWPHVNKLYFTILLSHNKSPIPYRLLINNKNKEKRSIKLLKIQTSQIYINICLMWNTCLLKTAYTNLSLLLKTVTAHNKPLFVKLFVIWSFILKAQRCDFQFVSGSLAVLTLADADPDEEGWNGSYSAHTSVNILYCSRADRQTGLPGLCHRTGPVVNNTIQIQEL